MHILICDDDAAFGTRMAEYVAAYFAARSILVQTAVCTSAGQALETPELELYQLAFLDVDMPGVNGMVLGRQLKQKCPGLKLVYVSAYLEFALEGYTVNAYRYLLKRDIVHTLPSCLDDLLAGAVGRAAVYGAALPVIRDRNVIFQCAERPAQCAVPFCYGAAVWRKLCR